MRYVALLFSLMVLQAADWPQFRGVNAKGLSADKNLPIEFGPTKNVVWKTQVPRGHSSPILAGARIYLTAEEGEKIFTLGLDRKTGKELWRREAPRPRKEEMNKTNSYVSGTPVSDGKNVYAFFGDFGLISYTADGVERWKLPMGPFNNINGHGSSPVIADGMLILIVDQDTNSHILALDKDTGKERWRTPRLENLRGYTTPSIYRPKSGPAEVVASGAFVTSAYELSTGKKLWWIRGMAWQLKGAPVIERDIAYINSWESGGDTETPPEVPGWKETLAQHDANKDGLITEDEAPKQLKKRAFYEADLNHNLFMDENEWLFMTARRQAQNTVFAVRLGGRGDVTDTHVLWRYRKSLPNTPTPLLYQGSLFLVKDGGVVTSLNPENGAVFKQARLTGALEQYWASPVGGDGKIYMASQGGKVSVLRAAPEWEILKINELDDDIFATPAIVDGMLYVRTRSALYCFKNSVN